MYKPIVAIVGRPNVGKSTFFNKVVGKRIAIVEDEPGVTRDRVYGDAEWNGVEFSLVDTGGIDLKSTDIMKKHILTQAKIAIDIADVILFFTDGKEGLVPNDQEVAEMLRKSKKPVVLVVNKLDNFTIEDTYDFYKLGLGEPMPISSEQKRGLGDLLDKVVALLPKEGKTNEHQKHGLKIAIVGKPNVGKSSLTNKLVGKDRVIVSDIAGTTRDAVEVPFSKNGKDYLLIDTAGLRRKRSIEDGTVERYSVFRTLESIRKADVVLVVFDVTQDISEQDVRIAGLVHEEQKPTVIVLNKWDAVQKDTYTQNKIKEKLAIDLAYMNYFEPVFISALSGQNIDKLLQAVEKVRENNTKRITTGTLNEIIQNAIATTPAPQKAGKRLKILYATQTGIEPPTFVLFVNDTDLATNGYLRHIENCIRKSVDYSGTPIRITTKSRGEDDTI